MTRFKKIYLPLAMIVLTSAILSGCGRSGAPELPSSAYTVNDKGQKIEKPKVDKPFILDGLIK